MTAQPPAMTVSTIDYHTAGEPFRIVLEGAPDIPGATVSERRVFAQGSEEIDRIRAAMDAAEFSYEIIVIDDGSSDGSGDTLREIEGIRLIQFLTNRGSGSARTL